MKHSAKKAFALEPRRKAISGKHKIGLSILLILLVGLPGILTACSPQNNGGETPNAPNTPSSGEIVPTVVSVPDPSETARAYLNAWNDQDYAAMYNMLTTLSRDAISLEAFSQRYQEVEINTVLVGVDYEILQTLTNPTNAEVGYKVWLRSSVVPDLEVNTQMDLSLENDAWKVVWDESIIMPELAGGNRLSLETIWPTRGIIYDHNGSTLAADATAVAISVVPSAIEEDQYGALYGALQQLTGINAAYWDYKISQEDNPFILSLTEVPYGQFLEYEGTLSPFYNALAAEVYENTRLSYINEAGAHSVGWVGPIPAEEVDSWAEEGYPAGAKIGRSGVEAWGEEMLAGRPSADLYVVTPQNLLLTRLATTETTPSQSIYTTLDKDMQRWAQLSLQGFTGAVVVLERDTGKVLAIASSPTYDPNYADPNNPNSLWGSYFPDNVGRFFNRATQGQYPPGSIFKPITMAAALESGLFTKNDVLDCGHYWYGPGGEEFVDWTLKKERPASGELTLVEGLMRSCNIWFYEIGYRLYTAGETNAVAEMARGFGLASPTGIDIFPEEAGQIVDPDNQEGSQPWAAAVMQAIGQSDTTITPLQAAVYTAALGNGGTLFRPQMIDRVENTAGEATFEFTPVENGKLPVSEETLAAIKEGMLAVTRNPRGTAYYTFINRVVNVYGKTGTAQNPGVDAHAWFIGYTDEQREDLPDIAIAVIVENEGDGSEFGAPIFRRLMEVYFNGRPLSAFPWENRIGEIDPTYFMTPEELEAYQAEQEAQQNQNNNNNGN
ncbi:MAG: penicillin-binding transpeptidase domain-containing protein [Anaerolineales bacterium]